MFEGKFFKFTIFTSIIPLFLSANLVSGPFQSLKAGRETVRKPAVSGLFYPSDPDVLLQQVNNFMDSADPGYELNDVVALISPHAGYSYSGQVAGYSYRQIRGREYDCVVIISPSHIEYFSFNSVFCEGFYETPLGKIPIHEDLAKEIAAEGKRIKESTRGHIQERFQRGEHALEVQLPFLQTAIENLKIVPIVMGDQSWESAYSLGKRLGKILKGRNVLIVASSDLSHYHPYNKAIKIDKRLIDLVGEYNYSMISVKLRTREIEACGGGPIIAAMIAAESLGAGGVKVLKYANSGDVPHGDKNRVVGYMSAAIYRTRTGKGVERSSNPLKPVKLTKEEKIQLLDIARSAIESSVKGIEYPEVKISNPNLLSLRGAFVTIKMNGMLRGCIGMTLPVYPLVETVKRAARSAALEDPRFQPLKPSELKDIEIEISVLSMPVPVTDLDEIAVGQHGLIISCYGRQGLLLPQVAVENGWDRNVFLQQTCLKAGLPPDTWMKGEADISIFSAVVFSEGELKKD